MERVFDGKTKAKLGTKKNPARVHVATEKKYKEVETKFKKNNWEYIIELKPGIPEDTTDLEMLLSTPKTFVAEKKAGRNDPCPCGSGKKFKKCCGT